MRDGFYYFTSLSGELHGVLMLECGSPTSVLWMHAGSRDHWYASNYVSLMLRNNKLKLEYLHAF